MSDAISKAIKSIRELMDLVDTPDRALFLRGLNAIDALQALKSGKPDTKTHINLCQKNAEPVAAIKGWFHGECVVQALDPAAVLPAGMALYAAPQPVVPVLPTMQKAFVTAESGSGKYCMVFKFRTLGDLHAAHNEWVTQPVSQPVVPEGYRVERGSVTYNEILVTAPDGGQQTFWPDDAAYELIKALLSAGKETV